MSIAMAERARPEAQTVTISTFVVKAATGLMMAAAAFIVLFKLGAMLTPNAEAVVWLFVN
jgi:hypothetical protein